jgi:hypothetical protein
VARELSERPEETSIRLEQTAHGAAWNLERWQALAEALDDHQAWTPEEVRLALDLMGVPTNERPAPDAVCDAETCRSLLDANRERPEALKAEVLDPSDESERLEAMLGVPHDQSREAQLYRRYEAESWRKYMALTKALDLRVRKGEPQPRQDLAKGMYQGAVMQREPVAPTVSVVPPMMVVSPAPAPATTSAAPARPLAAAQAVSRDEAGDISQRLEGSHRLDGRPGEGRPLVRRGQPIR